MNDNNYLINDAEHTLKVLYADTFSEENWKAQRSVMEPLLAESNSNVLGILPTGIGKSFIYQYYAHNTEGTVLVIEPLNAIINDQVDSYNRDYGGGAFHLKRLYSGNREEITTANIDNNNDDETVNIVDPDLIYTSPETLYSSSFNIIKCFTEDPSRKISMIVIDEAHTLLDWGLTFRDDYLFVIRFIREIRKRYDVRLLLLTATLNRMQFEYLEYYLGLTLTVCSESRPLPSDDKVKLVPDSNRIEERYKLIIDNIDKKQEKGCTLFFFNTTKAVVDFRTDLIERLKKLQAEKYDEYDRIEIEKAEKAEYDDPDYVPFPVNHNWEDGDRMRELLKVMDNQKGDITFLLSVDNNDYRQAGISTFYGSMTPQEKENHMNDIRSFGVETGKKQTEGKRTVILYILTTKALSMGIDVDTVNHVVNISLPDSMSEYKQEIGRIRNPDDNTTYTIFCTQEERQQVLSRILPPVNTSQNVLSVISARIKVWDYLSLCNWFLRGKELLDISLDELLNMNSDTVIEIVNDLFPKCTSLCKEKIQKLFEHRIKKEQIKEETEKTHPRFLIHTSEMIMSVFGLEAGKYKCADDNITLDFFDYIVFNSLFTLARQKPGVNWAEPDRRDSLINELFAIMLGSIKPPRKDKENKERDEIINRINCSINKLFDREIICTLNDRIRKLIDTSDFSFPLTEKISNAKIIGFTGSMIGSVILSGRKKAKVTLPRLIAVYYSLLEVEMARRFFFVKIKNIRNISYKVKYFPAPVSDALGLKDDTHYHKYQVPNQFKKNMQESLVAIYKEESKRIKRKNNYYVSKSYESSTRIYEISAKGAYGLLSRNTQKAQDNYKADIIDNLIINRYWLRNNGKLDIQ
ncbi:MAG: DEAD/DEAH box helicase [Saccharofermentans sp.]|nr:DEAD/DEAH box helicase [Saccharofermentans sp.]